MSAAASAIAVLKDPRTAAGAALLSVAVAVGLATWSRPDVEHAIGNVARRGMAGFDTVAALMAARSPGERPEGELASLKMKRHPIPHERALAKVRPAVPETLANIVGPVEGAPLFAPPFTPSPSFELLGSPALIPAATPIPGIPGGFPAITTPPGGGGLIVPPINTPSPPVIPGSPTPSVPEPGTWAMMLIGLMVTAQIVKRSRGSATAE